MSNLIRLSFAAFAAPFLTSFILILAANGAFAKEFKLGDLEIIHPWSRATPGGTKVAIGYVVIKNAAAEPDRLVSATAEVAGSVGIDEMATTNGVATMRLVAGGVVIPAHGEIALKPGSYHLMIEDLKQPLKEGDSFKGTLTFEKAGAADVLFYVEAIGAKAPAGGDQMKGLKGMDHMKGM